MKKILFLLLVTILMLGCATFAPVFTPTPAIVPTSETPYLLPEPTDPTQLITVNPGETFDIVLTSNASTGYRWQLVSALDANFLQSVGQTYIAEQPVIPGSGGVDVWTFSALNPGETRIEFGYYPPGDATTPEETVTFLIRIE